MGFLDKTKELGKATADFGGKVGHKGVELGKKGVEGTKEALRTKLCVECKSYAKVDDNAGDCPIGGKRLSSASADTCPQKAFAPK
jgi:hypothetical protein